MLIGNHMVSNHPQNLDLQRDPLKSDGREKIFVDEVSGAVGARPGLQEAWMVFERETCWWCGAGSCGPVPPEPHRTGSRSGRTEGVISQSSGGHGYFLWEEVDLSCI